MPLVLAHRILRADKASHPGAEYDTSCDFQDDGGYSYQLGDLRGCPSGAQKAAYGKHRVEAAGAPHGSQAGRG
eukprot:CAMPEP_0197933470 /NCGR_PEP_ID=MMETSP1439-20131203/110237_1 /TAXON_ID=66791 /ORGANISM="Gonyaulax spinifera, Strain CCMP409" /LENGTH=72 /DNA_ID=CAMNT_0043556301 /DNA_START=15 /DNA_END=230 /DNA_ORIENTATION=-